MTAPKLLDVLEVLHRLYDPAWADGWDKVGLVAGDPHQPVATILFAIDPVEVVVDEAIAVGADLVVAHHPLLFSPVSSVAATTPKGRVIHRLIRHGIALVTAHTNADTPALGTNDAIARALGLYDSRVLLPTDDAGLDKVVTFVPSDAADAVRQALAEAGAGRIGDYDSASFTGVGTGRFRPLEGAQPTIGRVGELEVVPEERIEVMVPRALRADAVAALVAAHPYEEPAYDVIPLAQSRESARGHGRIGRLEEPTTLRDFARRVSEAFPATAAGVRVAGDPDRTVATVAVGAGAGDSLLDLVAGTEADVYVTSDLRHHPAQDFVANTGKALIDLAHWAAEWAWLPVASQHVVAGLGAQGYTVEAQVSTLVTDPWTFRI